MNSLLVYFTALVVAMILERQRARHDLSLRVRYRRAGMSVPQRRARVPFLEALLTLVLGLVFLPVGGAMLWRVVLHGEASGAPGQNATALLLAVGLGLCLSGARTLVFLRRERESAGTVPGTHSPRVT